METLFLLLIIIFNLQKRGKLETNLQIGTRFEHGQTHHTQKSKAKLKTKGGVNSRLRTTQGKAEKKKRRARNSPQQPPRGEAHTSKDPVPIPNIKRIILYKL